MRRSSHDSLEVQLDHSRQWRAYRRPQRNGDQGLGHRSARESSWQATSW